MNRRHLIAAALAALVAAAPVSAQIEDILVQQLRADGFTSIKSTRTLLGRIRIIAENGNFRREIVLNPRTDEIMRDVWENIRSGQYGHGLYDPDNEDSNYDRSGGRVDDDDNDDNDNDDDDNDNDNDDDDRDDNDNDNDDDD